MGAALERRMDLWPFLLAAGLAAAVLTVVEPRLDRALDQAVKQAVAAEGAQQPPALARTAP